MHSTLRRAGAVLDLFTPDEPEWGVTATAVRLGIAKSGAHELLVSLATIGLLQRVGPGRYRIGWRTVSLAVALLRTSALTTHASPVMRDLAEHAGATVRLVAWDRGRVICIARRHDGRQPGASAATTVTAVPVDGSAGAKVLLASRSRDEIEALWVDGHVQTMHASIEELQRDLDSIRVLGWAAEGAVDPPGGRAVAAPIRDSEAVVVAAISLDVPDAVSRSDGEHHARAVVAAASRISNALR